MNDLKKQIYDCKCDRCRALVHLVKEKCAVLQFSRSRAGRLCELAVVAAAGSSGMVSSAVAPARREYARHLGIVLRGPVSDSDEPVHIQHAVTHSNHNANASNRINLGQARASLTGDVFRLL